MIGAAARAVRQDAAGLYHAMTELLRRYQYRDRDRVGYRGLTITQCYVLDCLEGAGACPLAAVATFLHLDKSTTSRIVSGMLRKGLVRRGRDAEDARALRLEATALGRRRYAEVRSDLIAENVGVLEGFAPATRRSLIRLIRRLAGAVARRELASVEDPDGRVIIGRVTTTGGASQRTPKRPS